jgi:hypothetical protein
MRPVAIEVRQTGIPPALMIADGAIDAQWDQAAFGSVVALTDRHQVRWRC